MRGDQLWTSSGVTDYDWFYTSGREVEETEETESYFLVSGILKHGEIRSVSRLKYRFTNEVEATEYFHKLVRLHPMANIQLHKMTSQLLRGRY